MPRPKEAPFIVRVSKALGSLTFAVALISGLAVILIVSTTLESLRGTTAAQRVFYQAPWFDVFLGFLGLNILCSMLNRWPYKKKHTGFVTTHIGILILLAGSLITRFLGAEGQVLLYEGDKSDRMFLNTYEITVHADKGAVSASPLPFRLRPGRTVSDLPGGFRITAERLMDHAVEKEEVNEGAAGAPANPAVRLTITSGLAGAAETFWLVKDHPFDPDAADAILGPARIELLDAAPPTPEAAPAAGRGPKLVFRKEGAALGEIDLSRDAPQEIALGDGSFKVRNLVYYPHARVNAENRLENVSQSPVNPAVEFDLVTPDGGSVHLVQFALFPEFESMHGKKDTKGVEVVFTSPEATSRSVSPRLVFYPGEPWSYQFISAKGLPPEAPKAIREGETYPAGWMDFRVKVERLLARAKVTRRFEEGPEKKGRTAVLLALRDAGGNTLDEQWTFGETATALKAAGREVTVGLRQATAPLPFMISLEDFRKVNYPGTSRAASFESDVTLHDKAEHFEIRKTIKMNEPLDHRGWRVFQSSFIQDSGQGEASVFTAAKNPGIPLIYGGSIVIFIGIFLVFFIQPLSSLHTREK